jgi:hypothetical protein
MLSVVLKSRLLVYFYALLFLSGVLEIALESEKAMKKESPLSQANGPLSSNALDFIWGRRPSSLSNGENGSEICHGAYHDYYWYQFGNYAQPESATVLGHAHVLAAVAHLNNDTNRDEIVHHMQGLLGPQAALEASEAESFLNLSARLLLMIEFGVLRDQVNPRRYVLWREGSVKEVLASQFYEPLGDEPDSRTILAKSFDAWSIHNVAGIEVRFTDNLADHLRLVESDTVVLVFHHASFLEYQLEQYVNLHYLESQRSHCPVLTLLGHRSLMGWRARPCKPFVYCSHNPSSP